MKIISIVALMSLSVLSHAEKIIITGQPLLLEQRDNVYYVPTTYVAEPSVTYMYVTIDGAHRVCFLNPDPALVDVEVTQINVDVKGQKVLWNCYAYNTTYFEARP